MPYADIEEKRRKQRKAFKAKYRADAKFRKSEAKRKAEWLQTPTGRQLNNEASKRAIRKRLTLARKRRRVQK